MCVFLSSRRRHTRWPRDWSSDVCSSDLRDHVAPAVDDVEMARVAVVDAVLLHGRFADAGSAQFLFVSAFGDQRCGERRRSEERRVGRECTAEVRAYPCTTKRWMTTALQK